MFGLEDLPDHIFKELYPVCKFYHDEKTINKVNTLNIHVNDSETVVSASVTAFVNKIKGIIRKDECAYLDIESRYIKQSCFLAGHNHTHVLIIVTTKYDDPYDKT